MNTTSIVLADDHAVVRAGIKHLLMRAPDIKIIGEACNGLDALHMAEELKPDVILLDLEMPALTGVEVAQQLREEGSLVRILILSGHEDKQYILELLNIGVAGYLTKDELPEVIIEAIRGISRGEDGWLSPRIAAKISPWMRGSQQTH